MTHPHWPTNRAAQMPPRGRLGGAPAALAARPTSVATVSARAFSPRRSTRAEPAGATTRPGADRAA